MKLLGTTDSPVLGWGDACQRTFAQTHGTCNPKSKRKWGGPGVTVVCQCGASAGTIVPQAAVVNGGGCACAGDRDVWELSVPASQFGCEPKPALKIVYF